MPIIGNPRSFHKKFKFVVEIDDVGHAGFQKASKLSVEVANVQYFEGGSLIPIRTVRCPVYWTKYSEKHGAKGEVHKSPGRLTF